MSSVALHDEATISPSATRAVIAACIGNMLEWYDFIVYATFAVQISHAFFPGTNEFASMLATLVTFGVGFLARPVGAAVIGAYADKAGRRAALTLTILLMASGTFLIAICPSFGTIGIAAPLLLVLARLIQGISAGGEIGGALAMLVEYAPPAKRGYYAAFQQLAQGGSFLLCGLLATLITSCFTAAQVNDWAWRLAFLFGIVIAPIGFYIRKSVAEPAMFAKHAEQASHAAPLKAVLSGYWAQILLGIGTVVAWTVSTYVTLYMPTFAFRELKIPQASAYLGLFVVGVIVMFCPLAGKLADRYSRRSVMLVAALCMVIYPYPAFLYLTQHPTGGTLIALQVGLALLMAFYTGPASALVAELFPTKVRCTGIALTYGIAVAVFGGFTPAITSALINFTGNKLSIAFWLMAAAVISSVSLLFIKDRSRVVLD
jgi:MHS family proline/betaine transporter-like MFS transporter